MKIIQEVAVDIIKSRGENVNRKIIRILNIYNMLVKLFVDQSFSLQSKLIFSIRILILNRQPKQKTKLEMYEQILSLNTFK